MAEHPLQALMSPPEAVGLAAEVVAGLDRCLLLGFGRLGPEQTGALETLGRIFAGEPLGEALGESLAALGRLEFLERHFVVLAAARAALLGAQHDALREQAIETLGRRTEPAAVADGPECAAADGPVAAWCDSTRHWLMELALTGFKNLDHESIAPFSATLEHLRSEPRLARLASLLIGFQAELLHALPIAALPVVPIYRWADLWTRGLVGTLAPTPRREGRPVSGRLSPLGIDLRQHGLFVSADVYALLEETGRETPRVVRTTVSAYKVDAVRGEEVWSGFGPDALALLRAPVEGVAREIDGLTLLETGDLIWDGPSRRGPRYAPLELAARWLAPGGAIATPVLAPADRHPVPLAEPVYLDGYRVTTDGEPALCWGDAVRLPLAVARPLPGEEAQLDLLQRTSAVRASGAMLGLLRFDGGRWGIQPLAVRSAGTKGADTFVGPPAEIKGSSRKKKGSGDTLAVLRERAGRLLRKRL